MTHMFDNYPQPNDYIPTNRRIKLPCSEATIMPGETTVHSFDIPFNIDEAAKDYKIIYKLGLNIVLEKGKEEAKVLYNEHTHCSIITWVLTPEETMLFKNTLLQAQAQIRFIMKDDTIAFTEISQVKVEDSLEV